MPSTMQFDSGQSKSGQSKPAEINAPSLAWRLTVTYAGSTCLLLLVAAGLMYYQLLVSLKHENDSFLSEEVRELRRDLHETGVQAQAIQSEFDNDSPGEDDAFPTYLRLLGPGDQVLAQTPGMQELLPPAVFSAVASDESSPIVWQSIRSAAGKHHRFQIGTAAISGAGSSYVLQVGMDLREEDALLSQYRRRIYAILVPALLAAVVAGYALANSGLRSLRRILRALRRVESTTLDQRIDPSGFPGEVAKLADSFNEMLGRIEDAFGRLSKFSADIAHELRTPLGCVRGELEVALSKARTPEEYRHALESCLEESVRLGHLIDRLLFLARAERQEAVLRLETVDLGREFENLREFYEAGAADAGIVLSVEVQPNLRANVDRTLLQSAMGNLLENAISHTPSGGKVELSARQDNGHLCLRVRDTGKGIPPEHLPFVLDRFYRVDGARNRGDGNSGLGLAIVKSIATLHQGKVDVDSKVGAGTSVTLVLPAAAPAPEPTAA